VLVYEAEDARVMRTARLSKVPKRIPAAPNPYCTTKVSFVLCVNVVEPEVKLPVTVRA